MDVFIPGWVLFLQRGVGKVPDYRDFSELLPDGFDQEISSWLFSFSNASLIRHLGILNALRKSDIFSDSLFSDFELELYHMLEWECVRRIGLLASCECGFGSVVR